MADPEGLFAAYHHRVFKYFCRAVGQGDTARDLTQEVFLRVSRSPVATNGDGSAWLFRIARNIVLDHHRSRSRHPESPALTHDEATRPAHQDVSTAVNEAMAALPALDRDVFLMREVAGLGYDEIAEACELSPDAVRSRIHRTRVQLRDQLAAPIATSRTMATTRSGRTRKDDQ
jgi:RNA polymerase sigma-70 factor (ECF subfamily)